MADDRRARFVLEYAKDLNATQAAVRAGYSPKTADRQGSRLLSIAEVRVQVDALLSRAAQKSEVTVERTLQEIARIAYGDTRKLFRDDGSLVPLSEMDDDTAALVASIETETRVERRGESSEEITTRKVKRWDKVRALDQCMAYLGMNKSSPAGTASFTLNILLSGGQRIR